MSAAFDIEALMNAEKETLAGMYRCFIYCGSNEPRGNMSQYVLLLYILRL